MNLMLAFIFACVVLGLLTRRFGVREQLIIATLATVMTALYYFRADRFM